MTVENVAPGDSSLDTTTSIQESDPRPAPLTSSERPHTPPQLQLPARPRAAALAPDQGDIAATSPILERLTLAPALPEGRASISSASLAATVSGRSSRRASFIDDDAGGGAVTALVRQVLQNPGVAAPHDERANRITVKHFTRSLEASANAEPAPIYEASIPAEGEPWGDARVEQAWGLAVDMQADIRARIANAPASEQASLRARFAACLDVDLREVPAGTTVACAPVDNIQEKYALFRAFCQETRITLKDGEVVDTDANILLPVLVRAMTATADKPAFTPDAHILNEHPERFLASLVNVNAPGNPRLSGVMDALIRENPHASTLMGTAALMDMAQQIQRGWQNYVMWAASIGVATGIGFLTKVQNQSTRRTLGLGPDESAGGGWNAGALGLTDSTASGETDMFDPPFLSNLDKLTQGEKLELGFSTLGDMATAFTVGTVTQLPAAAVPYSRLSDNAKIGLGFPLNLLAAAGGGSGLAITLRAQYDHTLAAIAEKVANGFLGPMSKDEIVDLGTLCQSIATGSQIMEKGGSWVLYSGLVAAVMQAKGIDAGPAQRILLNLVEINSAMIGSNTASGRVADFLSKTIPALGKTQEQKSDAAALLAIRCARENRRPTVDELRACYIGKGFEQVFQGAGRGLNNGVKGMIEFSEMFARTLLSRLTGGRVSPRIFRERIDFEAADSSHLPGQLSIEAGEPPAAPVPTVVVSEHVDLEAGDLDFRRRQSASELHELDELPRPPGAFPR